MSTKSNLVFGENYFPKNISGPQGRAIWLQENDRMKGKYLGACLDGIRWGGETTVMYEMGTRQMIGFIQEWMNQNKGSLLWHEKQPPKNFSLPYTDLKECPSDSSHERTVKDMGGRIRCAHQSIIELKPSFVDAYRTFDERAQAERISFIEETPIAPGGGPDEDEEDKQYDKDYKKYEKQLAKFENEDPVFIATDLCYAVLSDKGDILSLEEILNRLNLNRATYTVYCTKKGLTHDFHSYDIVRCKLGEWDNDMECLGHTVYTNNTVHDFDGWYLAWHVQRWHEQLPDGKAPVLGKRKSISTEGDLLDFIRAKEMLSKPKREIASTAVEA